MRWVNSHLVLLILLLATPALAEWSHDSSINDIVADEPGDKWFPEIIADGAGGVILSWADYRNGNYDIYAQRLDAHGNHLWGTDGLLVCGAALDQALPRLVSDDAGGAIITWTDLRDDFDYAVYAQRVDAAGNALWITDGVLLTGADGDQGNQQITGDGAGGAIVAWQEGLFGLIDIYAQRVDASGNLLWGANGTLVCGAAGMQEEPQLVGDGAGGATFVWLDLRLGVDNGVYAQRLDGSGNPLWTPDGIVVFESIDDHYQPRIIADGTSGAIISWYERRGGGSNEVIAQRIDASGNILWDPDGIEVLPPLSTKYKQEMVSDGAGGAILVFENNQFYPMDIRAQRILSTGERYWNGQNGIEIAVIEEDQYLPQIAADGAGGAVITWYDSRDDGVTFDIYAQWVSAQGDTLWPANGILICGAPNTQENPVIAFDGHSGAIIAWEDERASDTDEWLVVQRIDRTGHLGDPAPVITAVEDYPNDEGGVVILSWSPSYLDDWPVLDVDYYSVWRRQVGEGRQTGLADLDPSFASHVYPSAKLLDQLGRSGWMYEGSVEAVSWEEYAFAAATFGDSSGSGMILTEYSVIAHDDDLDLFWISMPDSGYSVDNLAPGPPQNLRFDSPTVLAWDEAPEEDFDYFTVYGSDEETFDPETVEIIGQTIDTTLDVTGTNFTYYHVTATDFAGNEGEAGTVERETAAMEEVEMLPGTFALHPSRPNPFNPVTIISYDLPTDAPVQLRIYNSAGRLVRQLVNEGTHSPGRYRVEWDGRDSRGHLVGSGNYFYHLEAGPFGKTRSMVLVK